MRSIKASCRIRWAAHNSGPRSRSQLKWIVLHDTEGGSAASVANQFASPDATASTQLVVDQIECYRMVLDLTIPWGAPGGNTAGLHIEQVGWAHWTRGEWLAHDRTLRRSAYKAARWSKAYGIPLRWVGKWGLKLGHKGVTTHNELSRAFLPGGHTDPGPNFPKDVWMRYAKEYRAAL